MIDDEVCHAIRAAFRTIDPRKAINLAGMAAHVVTGYGNASREPTVRSTGNPGAPRPRDEREVLRDARVLRVLYHELDETTRLLTMAHCHGIGQKRMLAWLRLGAKLDEDGNEIEPAKLDNNEVRRIVEAAHALVARAIWRPPT